MIDSADPAAEESVQALAVPAWEDPPRVAPRDAAPILSVDGFEGPLDWLLEMARARKLDLAKLSIAALIEAFAMAMNTALAEKADPRIERWASWIVMAATLTEWWSRRLLPSDAPEVRQAEAEAEALRSDLLNRAQMQAAANWLEQCHQLGQETFPRGGKGGNISKRVGDLTELLRACLVALRVPEEQAAAYRPRPPPFWTVRDAKARVEKLLPTLPDGSPLEQFLPRIAADEPRRVLRCRVAVSNTLVAGLELARNGALALDQKELWSQIRIQHPKRHAVGAEGELAGF